MTSTEGQMSCHCPVAPTKSREPMTTEAKATAHLAPAVPQPQNHLDTSLYQALTALCASRDKARSHGSNRQARRPRSHQ